MKDNRPAVKKVRSGPHKCFRHNVLDNITFDIKKGEFICVVGPTGCGKTTFLNLLTKIHEPTSGELLIDGEPANRSNLTLRLQEAFCVSLADR